MRHRKNMGGRRALIVLMYLLLFLAVGAAGVGIYYSLPDLWFGESELQIGDKILNLEALPGEVVELSNSDHGETLVEVMEGIREEDYEIIAFFTEDGEKLFEHTDHDGTRVSVDDVHLRFLDRYENVIVVHNHPVEGEASFSSADLDLLASVQAKYGIVVSRNDNYVVFPNGKWPKPEKLTDYISKHSDLFEHVRFYGEDGSAQLIPVVTARLMKLVAQKYDLGYYDWPKSEVSAEEIAEIILGQ